MYTRGFDSNVGNWDLVNYSLIWDPVWYVHIHMTQMVVHSYVCSYNYKKNTTAIWLFDVILFLYQTGQLTSTHLTVSSAWKIVKFPGSGDCDTTATALLELLLPPHAVESSTEGKGWSSRSHCTTAPSVALTTQVSVAFSPNRSVALDGKSRNTV